MVPNYSSRFSKKEQVASYERDEYDPKGYSAFIWKLQQPFISRELRIMRDLRGSLKLLDFACGTGRVLSFVEDIASKSEGIDISEQMAGVARERCGRSDIQVGDVCTHPEMMHGPYDVITMFRFVLNAGTELSSRVLECLREQLRPDGGILIANLHGNSRSIRHLAIARHKRHLRINQQTPDESLMLEEMSPMEVEKLFSKAGFRVLRSRGFGMVPRSLYRGPLGGLARAIDSLCSKIHLFTNVSTDIIFVFERTQGR